MLHATGWHTYWKNPGDAGLPTRIEWQLPEGWSAGDIEWPAPRRIANGGGFASYGYEGELVLPVMVFTPRDWNGRTPVQLSARVSWLACRETCIPESAQLSLELPVSAASTRTALLERFLQRTPEAFNFSAVRAQRHDHRLQLVLEPAREGEFFPDQEQLIEPGDAPVSQRTGQAVMWSAKLGEQGEHYAVGTHISGIWIEKGARPRRVEAALDSP